MRQALATKTGDWNRVRLFLVGDAAAGKSSLLRWLKGGTFDGQRIPTDGAVLETLDLKDWKIVQYHPISMIDTTNFIVDNQNEAADRKLEADSKANSSSEKLVTYVLNIFSRKDRNSSTSRSSESGVKSISERVVSDLVEKIERIPEVHSDGITLHVWDCGGQKVYYNTHHFFFTSTAIYLVVVDLSSKDVENTINQLHFWIRSIQSYAPSASISVVATHTDLMSDAEVEGRVKAIRESYNKYCDPPGTKYPIYAISCATGDAESRDKVRSHVLERAMTISREMQCYWRWILLFDNIYGAISDSTKQKSRELSIVKLDEARQYGESCGLAGEKDLKEALEFFHKQGLALHFNGDNLSDTIFMKPQELVDAFRTIVTANIVPDETSESTESPSGWSEVPLYPDERRKLREEGHLSLEAMKRIWDGQGYSDSTQQYLRTLLIRFGLAVRISETSSDLVLPCLVSKILDLEEEVGNDWSQKVKKWEYQIESKIPPLGFSSLLIVRLIQLATTPGKPPLLQVYKDACFLVLKQVSVYIKVHSVRVELFFVPSQRDKNHRMAEMIVEVVRVIRELQQLLVKGNQPDQSTCMIHGSLEGVCLKCQKNKVTIGGNDLLTINASHSQLCCRRCRAAIGSYLLECFFFE